MGLLGDNGAGKSTLIKILTGVHEPTCGCLYWEGRSLENHSVNKARNMGIETVFQDRALCEQHSIWRNVFMGREIVKKSGLLDVRQMKRRTAELMKNTMGFTSDAIEPDNIVGCMSGGEKQAVAISRACRSTPPDHSGRADHRLFLAETQKGWASWRIKEGRACIFISHTSTTCSVVDRIVLGDRGKVAYNYGRTKSCWQLIRDMYEVAGMS